MRVLVLVPPSKFSRNVARDLVYGCWCKGKRIAGIKFPPLSLLFVATVLKKAGHDVALLDAAATLQTTDDVLRMIGGFDVAIVLTSSMTIREDAELLSALKQKNPGLITMVFGSQATFMPEATLKRAGIDIVVRREAEGIIRDFVDALQKKDDSWKKVLGIGYKEKDVIYLNEPYPFIENLDQLPIPDRSMLPEGVDYFNPIVQRMPYTTMFTSRGCPGRCTYCSSPSFYGRTIRYRSASNILDELSQVAAQGYKEVFFRDEIFTVNRSRVVDICEGIISRNLDLTWICSARIGSVDRDLMRLMKKAGCHMIRFGVESGVQEILDRIQKGIRLEQTEETFRWCHETGIETHAHLMIGMPGETAQTIKTSIAFIKKIDPTIITVGICTPYPGTKLFEEVLARCPEIADGSECDLESLHTRAFHNDVFCSLTAKELSGFIRRFYRAFYLRPAYLWKWVFRIRSLEEFKRVLLAATNVFDFIFRGD